MSVDVTSANPFSESHQLIALLLLEAGRIMEDASPVLALRLPHAQHAIDHRLACARQAGDDVSTLIAADEVLQRRSGNS